MSDDTINRAAPSAAPGEAVSEAWHEVWKYLAHRDDDEFECREHRDGPGTCDCGLTPTVARLTAALRAAPAPVRVSEAMVEAVVTRIAADPDGTPVRHRLFSAEDVRRAVREGAALAAQEGT